MFSGTASGLMPAWVPANNAAASILSCMGLQISEVDGPFVARAGSSDCSRCEC